jgi:hypothetical protein
VFRFPQTSNLTGYFLSFSIQCVLKINIESNKSVFFKTKCFKSDGANQPMKKWMIQQIEPVN